MNRIQTTQLFCIAISFFVIACSQSEQKVNAGSNKPETFLFFGERINGDSSVSVEDLKKEMGNLSQLKIKVTGTVESVCQKKGCWMDLKTADGEGLRVTFKDYGFFMPKDCAGKTAIAEGIAIIEETSVADLKEYAKDAGKTRTEIEAIREPKKELVFEASGVILQ